MSMNRQNGPLDACSKKKRVHGRGCMVANQQEKGTNTLGGGRNLWDEIKKGKPYQTETLTASFTYSLGGQSLDLGKGTIRKTII